MSGGDIKNAVLKAATAAAAEPGSDTTKRIHQRHFERAMEDVVAGKKVMRQSLLESDRGSDDPIVQAIQAAEARWRGMAVLALGVAALALAAAVGAVIAVGVR